MERGVMSRTLIPELAVGTVALGIFNYLYPSVQAVQYAAYMGASPDMNLSMIAACFVVTLGAYALIAVYMFAIVGERCIFAIWKRYERYAKRQRREYL